MKRAIVLGGLLCFAQLATATDGGWWKPRVINTTDLGADPDDEQSMVRQLVCANEFDLEGLIVTTGCWKKEQENTAMLDKIVDAYAKVEANLRVHAEGFPSAEYLRSISVMGQDGYGMDDVGEGKDSVGSDLIIASVDKDDPRPVWVLCWGGANNVAQAVLKVQQTRSAEELERFLGKLRVFDILGQDDAGAWLAKNFPNLFYIRATKVYNWQPSDEYLAEHIQSHGPLGAVYPDRKWATEGDTPAFMHVYPNGLNDPEQIEQGSWGGRFSFQKQEGIRSMEPVKNEHEYDPYFMYGNTEDGGESIRLWSEGYNNDFAARMDWTITPKYEDANHHPIAVVNGDETRNVLYLDTTPGSIVDLCAKGSSDPDGDTLQYKWIYYAEPGSYKGDIVISDKHRNTCSVQIPEDAAGKQLHIVLELADDGEPVLYAYRRVVIRVADENQAVSQESERPRVVVTSDFPPLDVIPVRGVKPGDPPEKCSDPDDVQSMVRFLLYSNELEVEALIASAGTYANIARNQNILDLLDVYEQVQPNLSIHDPRYPTADDLRAVTWQGMDGTIGTETFAGGTFKPIETLIGAEHDTEASEAIIRIVDEPDPRPVWVCVWGGSREVAQAIWKVQHNRSADELKVFLSKLRLYLIVKQDYTADWLLENFPNLFIILSEKNYQGMFWVSGSESSVLADLEWANQNVRNDHGPLGAAYPKSGWDPAVPGVWEGDSPSFLHLISGLRGINDPEQPIQGGWGGQFVQPDPAKYHWFDGPEGPRSVYKWREQFQEEFAERADWMVQE